MDDITAQLRCRRIAQIAQWRGEAPPTYKSLDEVTPTMELAKIKAWRRLEAAVASLKQILPPGKMDPVPQRIMWSSSWTRSMLWYFSPIRKGQAELRPAPL
jgi:hypothetical protein